MSGEASTDPFLAACRRTPAARRPVWFMRQAGRSLPEYRARRGEGSILDVLRHPELVAELTLQPVARYGVDAAILYSDIMVPASAVGFGVDVSPGIGPVVDRPFRSVGDLERLRELEPGDVAWMTEAIQILVKELAVPLIGFAGGPFTVASYLIEGGPSRTYAVTKTLMHSEPGLWQELMDRLAAHAVTSLRIQIEAGARAVQLFDSWAGALSPADYRRFVLPASRHIFDGVAELGAPRIHFGVGTAALLELMAEAGADVVGIDWRVPLNEARRRLGPHYALQGNLDPAVCLAPWPVVEAEARRVLAEAGPGPGHIFNLGHGVLPQTQPQVLERLAALVRQEG